MKIKVTQVHMKRVTQYFVGALSLSLTLMISLAEAWTPLGATWPNLPVPYEVNAVSSQELGSEVSINVIQASYASWTDPGCSGYRVQYRGTVSHGWTSGDGVNTHQWIYSSNQRPQELGGRETIGVTLSLYRGGDLVDGDILYNGIDHDWTTQMNRSGQVDAQSIITHEVGHQLGLGHTTVNGATMYPSYAGGEGPRTLSQDDIEGVCSLYPSGGAAQCSQSTECPAEQECVNGSCVIIGESDGQIGEECSVSPCDEELVCVRAQDDSAFCTRVCSDGVCPGGWACYAVNSSQGEVNLCLPEQGTTGDRSFGQNCESGPECISGLCVSDGQGAFCSQSCAQDADCPNQSLCQRLSNGGGACVPDGSQETQTPFGTPCERPSDCDNGLCLDDDVEIYCTLTCESERDCPEGADCFEAGEVNICAKTTHGTEMNGGEEAGSEAGVEAGVEAAGNESPSQLAYGELCVSGEDCLDGLCLSDGLNQFCSTYCIRSSDCPNGDDCADIGEDRGACVAGSAPQIEEDVVNRGGNNSLGGNENDEYEGENVGIKDELGCVSSPRSNKAPSPYHMLWLVLMMLYPVTRRSQAL